MASNATSGGGTAGAAGSVSSAGTGGTVSAGNGGTVSGGSAGASAGGSGGAPTAGKGGAMSGGSGGKSTGGSGGAPVAGSGGAPAAGSGGAPAAGNGGAPAGSGGAITGGSGGSGGKSTGGSGGAPAAGSGGAISGGSSGKGGTAAGGKGGTGGTAAGGKGGAGGSAGVGGKGGAGGSAGFGGGDPGCDPTKGQDICPAGQVCSVTVSGTDLTVSCNTPKANNTVTEGESCVRDLLGIDNCVPGLVCTSVDSFNYDGSAPEPKARVCKKWCAVDADCGAAPAACVNFTSDGFGLCITTCAPLDPCMGPMGQTGTCADIHNPNDPNGAGFMNSGLTFGCHKLGAGTDGDACLSNADCGAAYGCSSDTPGSTNFVCKQLCDATHMTCNQKMFTCGGGLAHVCSSDTTTAVDGTCAAMPCPAGDTCQDFDNFAFCQLSRR